MRLDIAMWFSLSLIGAAFSSAQAQDAAKGAELYKTCIQCHGDQGLGLVEKNAPRIAGQYDWYIVTSLKAFKSGERKNPEMLPFIKGLSEKDFADLAAYITKL